MKENKLRQEKILAKCGCICYCPQCKDILQDQAYCTVTDLVRYTCSCGYESVFNFDIAPVPILWDEKLNAPLMDKKESR